MSTNSLKQAVIVAVLTVASLSVGCAPEPIDESVFGTPELAIQQAIAEELGMPVSLEIEIFNEYADWAFVAGRPLTANGTPIDYSDTAYAEDLLEGYFDDNFVALARRSPGEDVGWAVVELSIGATDAPFVDWPERHGLPRTLVMPESDPD